MRNIALLALVGLVVLVARPSWADLASDMQSAVDAVDAAIEKVRQDDPAAVDELRNGEAALSSLIDAGGLNDLGRSVAYYYRAKARQYLNSAREMKDDKPDMSLAREALADFDRVIAAGIDDEGWGVDVSDALYSAGSIAYNQMKSTPMAYDYWLRCAKRDYVPCLNIMANARLTGKGGQKIDVREALKYHEKVFDSGTDYTCAGSFSAFSIAKINYFLGVRRPGDDEIVWLDKAAALADKVMASSKGRTTCGRDSHRIFKFLMLLSRGQRRDDILQPDFEQAKGRYDRTVAEFLTGKLNEAAYRKWANSLSDADSRCEFHFFGLWHAEIAKNKTLAREYHRLLLEDGREACADELGYAKKYGL
jgi:hypothetical protein